MNIHGPTQDVNYGVTETERFVFFWRGWPSQWALSPFEEDGVWYTCCEQYMMAEKARVFGDADTLAKILATDSPREQKALGRVVKNFDATVWNSVCRGIVYRANLAKYSQKMELKQLLLATENKTIVEASPMDPIWGIGLSVEDADSREPAKWRGTNWLGIALMQVRETLRAEAAGLQVVLEPELQRQLDVRAELREKEVKP